MPATEPAREMEALLGAEREALLSGALGQLPALIAAKERLLPGLESAPPADAALAERLHRRAAANQVLLDAALKGLRAARERIETARAGGPPLSTYDASGRAERHAPTRPSVTRRA